jgi:hypothetical protein
MRAHSRPWRCLWIYVSSFLHNGGPLCSAVRFVSYKHSYSYTRGQETLLDIGLEDVDIEIMGYGKTRVFEEVGNENG